jgi:hypothetical protein
MPYYGRRYRSWRSRGWHGSSAPSKYSILRGLFGEAVVDIKSSFLQLPQEALDELLDDYAAIHGDAAGRYARNTYPAWQSGKTQLSGQTMERLISLVPPYLSSEQRFALLQKVVKKHKNSGIRRRIEVNSDEPNEGFQQIETALSELVLTDPLANLPAAVMDAAKWLYDDDITAARAMLAEAERIENDLIRSNARKELELLGRTIKNKQIKSASYRVEMPAGVLQVTVYTPSLASKIWKSVFG